MSSFSLDVYEAFLDFQLHCCGVDGYEDFKKATEFIKYANEEGKGQVSRSCVTSSVMLQCDALS